MIQVEPINTSMTEYKPLSAYDIFKTAALLLMFIDHIGYYFFPDNQEWFRVIGRGSAPIWLFLIGYAQTRAIEARFIAGAALIAVMKYVVDDEVIPLSILITMLGARACLRYIAGYALSDIPSLILVSIATLATTLFVGMAVEYGTLAVLIALWGHHCRRKGDTLNDAVISVVLPVIIWAMYTAVERVIFDFDIVKTIGCAAVTGVMLFALSRFSATKTYTLALPDAVRRVMAWCGRHTLELYVMHVLIFMATARLIIP